MNLLVMKYTWKWNSLYRKIIIKTSITHTKNIIAIIIADFPCGIDIEQSQ